MRQNSRLNLDFSFSDGFNSRKQRFDESFGLRVFKIGYEVYADGLTRVLRICEHADNPKIEKIQWPIANVQFRISYVCIHLLDKGQVCSFWLPPGLSMKAFFSWTMPVIYSYLQVKHGLRYPFLFVFTLLKNGENVQLPSTILTARLQHVSSDSVITNRFKHVSVAIHVSIGPSAILYFN